MMLELGWKQMAVIGELVIGILDAESLERLVQQFSIVL